MLKYDDRIEHVPNHEGALAEVEVHGVDPVATQTQSSTPVQQSSLNDTKHIKGVIESGEMYAAPVLSTPRGLLAGGRQTFSLKDKVIVVGLLFQVFDLIH